ncbi:MAG: ATP-dependent sacrificial sulfur transferase LarE [Lachnospiraceae bacterium]|jgi:uncharacterized protein|nr:ATP-dependent sacrificial sulfur transferase LarE [Lachnospiraceae bacterium]
MKEKLKEYLKQKTQGPVAIAFSGGVDSALLLWAACQTIEKVYAICIKTTLHPMREAKEAKVLAEKMGAEFVLIEVDEFAEAGIEKNPVDRCYRCKRYMFEGVKTVAAQKGATLVMDGTNADDLTVYRPGIRALKELGIVSPLAELGIHKSEVRKELAEIGLSVSAKPSTPCLATRFPYGTQLTEEKLRRVDAAEEILREICGGNVRVREHEEAAKDTGTCVIARIEVDIEKQAQVLAKGKEVGEALTKLGYDYVTLDLLGFASGSMDKKIQK